MLIPQSTTLWPTPQLADPYVALGSISNNGVGNGPPDVNSLLAPVAGGLQRVEAKLRSLDSPHFAPLTNAFITLIGSGGKRLRPALALLSAEFGDSLHNTSQYERVIALAASVEMLHTSTLVHDDVIDGAMLRRGAPTLNALWSGGATVLAGNFMFGAAAHFSAETENMRVIRVFSETLQVIVDGELQQLLARYDYRQPKDNYYQRIYAKTASLFCAASEGAAVLTGLPDAQVRDLHDFGYNFGMAFQIVDDILDFTGDESSLGKPAGSDLRQGTLTLPFFYFLSTHPHADDVVAKLEAARSAAEEGDTDGWQRTVNRMVGELRTSTAVEAARIEAHRFLGRAQANLTHLPDNTFKRSLVGLCDFVVHRTY